MQALKGESLGMKVMTFSEQFTLQATYSSTLYSRSKCWHKPIAAKWPWRKKPESNLTAAARFFPLCLVDNKTLQTWNRGTGNSHMHQKCMLPWYHSSSILQYSYYTVWKKGWKCTIGLRLVVARKSFHFATPDGWGAKNMQKTFWLLCTILLVNNNGLIPACMHKLLIGKMLVFISIKHMIE